MKTLHSRVNTTHSGSPKKPACGACKRDGSAKTKRPSARARVAAGKKAAHTRRQRATVLKTLKTGEESFGVAEENVGENYGSVEQQPPQHACQTSVAQLTKEDGHERLARKAYELYQQQGEEPGHDLDDWVLAER